MLNRIPGQKRYQICNRYSNHRKNSKINIDNVYSRIPFTPVQKLIFHHHTLSLLIFQNRITEIHASIVKI